MLTSSTRASTVIRHGTALFILAPFVAVAFAGGVSLSELPALAGAIVFALTLCALPALVGMPRWLTAPYYLLLNTIAAVVLYSTLVTGGFPTLATCLATLKTDPVEARETFRATAWSLSGVVLLWLAQLPGCVSFCRKAPTLTLRWPRLRIVMLAPLTIPMWALPVAQTYPANLPELAFQTSHYLHAVEGVDTTDQYRVTQAQSLQKPELVVFVIGESSRAKFWQLYGYPEPSTPALVRRQHAGELVVLRRHMSTASATRFAVPALLSPFEVLLPVGGKSRPSLVTIMNRAGYATGWLSVQGPLPATAEAQETNFTGDGDVFDTTDRYDARLLPQAAKWTQSHESTPAFLVLHTAGSHIPYESRYPADMAQWHDHEGLKFPRSQTVGSYLNTVRYTDTVLNSLMDQLAKEDRPVLLVYVSDHGDTNMDQISRDRAPTDASVLHVPFIVWSNEQWKQARPAQWKGLQQLAQSQPVTSHFNVVPTLTSVLGIDYEGKPVHRDLLSPTFQPWTTTPALRSSTMGRIEVTPPPAYQP